MNPRRRKKVAPALSVEVLENRCLPSAMSIVHAVTDLEHKITESVPVHVADIHAGSGSEEATEEHRQDTAPSRHDKDVVSVDIDTEHRSVDNIPALVTTESTAVVVSEPVHGASDASHGRVGESEAASVEVTAAPVAVATTKATTSTAAAAPVAVAAGKATTSIAAAAAPVAVAAGKATVATAVPVAEAGPSLKEFPAVAVGMAPAAPDNLPRPEVPGAAPAQMTPLAAGAADGPAAGNPVRGAAAAVVANPVIDEEPSLTGESAAPAPDGFYLPLGGDLIADLPIRMPDFAAVERAFDQLADYVGLDGVRGGGSWLLAAAMAAAATEVARRQMKPMLASGLPPEDGPPPGWLPEGNEPMPGDDGHA